MKFIKETC